MLVSRLFGESALSLRLGHVLLGALGSFVGFLLYRRLVGPRAGLASLLALSFAPFWFPFGIVATPEGPLLFFWTLALLLFLEASSRESIPWSVAAGAAAGLAILSKYNGGLLFASFFVFLWLDPRRPLRRPHPYVAMISALAVWSPNLIWSATHGGTALAIPFHEGLRFDQAPKHVGLLLLHPLVLLTPLVAWAWLRQTLVGLRTGRLRDEPGFRLAVLASWIPFAAFGVVALTTEIHLQWAVPCFVTAVPIALENLGRVGAGVSPRFLRASLVTGGALLAVVAAAVPVAMATARHEGPGEPRGLAALAAEARGWEELRERIGAEVEQRGAGRPVFITSPGYHLAAHLEWIGGGRYPSQPLNRLRQNQYLVWKRDRDFVGWDALYVNKRRHRDKEDALLRGSCRSVEELDPIMIDMGEETRRFVLFWCHEFKGLQ
jgi:4-amino-4-deoxy-L-arabinose transferase-like glycosyltransferase